MLTSNWYFASRHRHVLERAVRAVAGVVDEDVDPAGVGDDLLDAGDHRGVVRDVHLRAHGSPASASPAMRSTRRAAP